MVLPACARIAQDKQTKLPDCRMVATALEPFRGRKTDAESGASSGLGGVGAGVVAAVSGEPEKVPT